MFNDDVLELESHHRRINVLFVAVTVLLAAIVGAAWYGYPRLVANRAALLDLMGAKPVVSQLHDKVSALEQNLDTAVAYGDKLNERVAGLEKLKETWNARLVQLRTESAHAVADAEHRIGGEMGALQSRVASVEGTQQASEARLEALQGELARTKEEMATLRQQTDEQMSSLHHDAEGQFSDVNQRIASTRTDVDKLSNRISNFRLQFETNAGRSEELYSGIRLNVNSTNVEHQNAEGWIQLVSSGRTIWVRNQGINQPIVFYPDGSERPYQLVFTRILGHSAVGYLLIPNEPSAKPAVANE